MRIIIVQIILYVLLNPLNAQIWDWAGSWGGIGTDVLFSMKINTSGDVSIAGNYNNEVDFGVANLQSIGGSDVFLTKLDDAGNALWAVSGGSLDNDLSIDAEFDSEGNTIWLGQYWVQGFFENDTIYSGSNAKAYFVAKYAPDGTLIWLKTINGSSTKVVSDLTVDQEDDIYLAGHFNDSLIVADEVLTSTADEDAFVLKMSSEGTVVWAKNFGISGVVRPQRINRTSTGNLVIAGNLTGSVSFADDELISVTTDFDVFIALLDQDGVPVWGRIGTGVRNNLVNALAIDADDNIYVSGKFIGVLAIDGETIATPGFLDNLYLLKLSDSGAVIWARGLNDQVFNEESVAFDIVIQDPSVLMVGQFEEALIIDNLQLNADGRESFIAAFSMDDGVVEKLSNVPGGASTVVGRIGVDGVGRLHIGGAFFDAISFSGMALVSEGSADVFVAQASAEFTGINDFKFPEKKVSLYPNPVVEWLYLNPLSGDFEIEIFDLLGRAVLRIENETQINLQSLTAGKYYIRYRDKSVFQVLSFVKL